jgi:hypothetical protein
MAQNDGMGKVVRKRARWLYRVPLLLLGALFLALLFADEIARGLTDTVVPAPVELPPRSEIRESATLVKLLGFGAPGGAGAVTVGRIILVSPEAARLRTRHERAWKRMIEHERAHVVQRLQHGRFYLPAYCLIYGGLWFRYGSTAYLHHPFELEAGGL